MTAREGSSTGHLDTTHKDSAAEKPVTSQTHLLERLIKSLLHCLSSPQFMYLFINELESHKYT